MTTTPLKAWLERADVGASIQVIDRVYATRVTLTAAKCTHHCAERHALARYERTFGTRRVDQDFYGASALDTRFWEPRRTDARAA